MSDTPPRKVAFVTGGSSGIGRAAATLFARRGYATVLADLNEAAGAEAEAHLRAEGLEALFVPVDVACDKAVGQAVARAASHYGGLHAAFNAAGIDGEFGRMTADCSVANWNSLLAVNLTGVWLSMRHEIPAILASGGGAIVNCASTAGLRGAPTCAAYSAAKHGVVGLTKTAALEYAGQGVRINAVCPGMIDTPMTRNGPMADLIATLVEQTPLRRIGQPEEIAAAAVWLCSDEASFVHGQAVPVDGAITSR